MERRGVKVDVKYLQDTLVAIEDRVKGCYASLPSGFNVRSPKCVKDYVEAAGHTDWPLTEKNNPSFDENWLKGFPEGQKIVEIRKWTNLANTFAKPLVNEHVHKGRVHANFNQLKGDDGGTIARLSCSHPNLQAVPKRDKELAKLFRKGFVADDGMTFFEDDYSQCEPRLFASYSADVNLVNGYNQTPFKDAHSVVAELLNVERDPTAKRMNMGIFTGMYPKAFAGHMNWSIVQATEAWNKWFELFPGIRGFQDKAKEVLVYRGYVKTLLGRRGRLENPRFAYRATSKIIQGSNADILKYFMVKLDKMLEADGDHTHLLMTIHDAFQGQFPDGDEGKQYHEMMREIMVKVQEPPFNLRVPFVVDSGYGKTWCDATFGGKK
jgi:DNA polymerase-1